MCPLPLISEGGDKTVTIVDPTGTWRRLGSAVYPTHTMRLDTKVTSQKAGTGRPPTPHPPGSKTRTAVLNPLLQKVPRIGQNSLILWNTAAIHSTWTGITSRPGCLATTAPSHPPPANQVGKKQRHPQRAAEPNSGWSSISPSTDSGSRRAPQRSLCSCDSGGTHAEVCGTLGYKGPNSPSRGQLSWCSLWENITWPHPTSPLGPPGWSHKPDALTLQRPPRALSQSAALGPLEAKMQSSKEGGKPATWEFCCLLRGHRKLVTKQVRSLFKGERTCSHHKLLVRLKGVRLLGLPLPGDGRWSGWAETEIPAFHKGLGWLI